MRSEKVIFVPKRMTNFFKKINPRKFTLRKLLNYNVTLITVLLDTYAFVYGVNFYLKAFFLHIHIQGNSRNFFKFPFPNFF